jgi:hypothetical protein
MGVPRENIKEIEAACEKLYLKSRSLEASYQDQDILLNKLIEELVNDAIIKISNEERLLKKNNSDLEEYHEKMIVEIKKIIEKNRYKLDKEAGYYSLKKFQDNADFLLQYDKDDNVLVEREPSLSFIIDCLKNINGKSNSFCILSDKTLSYIQCAGSIDKLTLEYRKYEEMKFKHYVVGFKKLLKKRTTVDFNGRKIPVKSNEILKLVEVLKAFESFYNRKGIPPKYGLRDISNNMKCK